jgi:hypothetical protein
VGALPEDGWEDARLVAICREEGTGEACCWAAAKENAVWLEGDAGACTDVAGVLTCCGRKSPGTIKEINHTC